ncbi:peptidoglycan-binding protein [Thermodesulfobacteriota bacterium]
MNKRKLILSFFLITIFLFCVVLSPEVVYSQSYDKTTVLNTQRKLQELGYNPGTLDGIWGKKTNSALKRFQHDNDLSMTGKLDSITIEKLGIISLEKSVPKRSVSVISIRNSVKEALKHEREIKKVQIENDILRVVPDFDFVSKQGYASIILDICRNANLPNQFKQVWILNTRQNQGWVLLKAKKCCNQVRQAPLNQVDKLIFKYSADVIIFESR